MIIENGVAIDRQLTLLADRLLKMQIGNPAKDVARNSVLLFELGRIALDVEAAKFQLDPVLEIGRFFLGGRGGFCFRHFLVTGLQRVTSSQGHTRNQCSGSREPTCAASPANNARNKFMHCFST